MLLSDIEIKHLMFDKGVQRDQRIEITLNGAPIPVSRVGTASVDLTLSNHFMRLRSKHRQLGRFLRNGSHELDLARVNGVNIEQWYHREECLDSQGIRLGPGELVLASTTELVKLPPTVGGLLIGRNSYARMGLQIAAVANLKDPGHKGHITLHLRNLNAFPIRIYPGLRVCQLIFFSINSACERIEELGRYGYEEEVGTTKFYLDEEAQELFSRTRSKSTSISLVRTMRLSIVVVSGLASVLLGTFTMLPWSMSALIGFVLSLILFVLLEILKDSLPHGK